MFTNKIKQLQATLEQTESVANESVTAIKEKLQREFDKYFKSLKTLETELNNASNASEYMFDKHGEIASWYRSNLISDFQDCKEYFENYVSEHGFRVDWDNDCFEYSQGGCIVINDDGAVYDTDSNKFIVSRKDYETDAERNSLIEAWMDKNGYFPGVFRADTHGNVFLVNTQNKEK